jgi:hypothetical protein
MKNWEKEEIDYGRIKIFGMQWIGFFCIFNSGNY